MTSVARFSVAQAAEQVDDLAAGVRIQVAGRLVGQEQVRAR